MKKLYKAPVLTCQNASKSLKFYKLHWAYSIMALVKIANYDIINLSNDIIIY